MSQSTQGTTADEQQRIFLFSAPRTASHLLMRMLCVENQSDIASYPADTEPYFFMQALQIRDRLSKWAQEGHELTNEDRASLMKIYQSCGDNMEKYIREHEELGQSVFIKEHTSFIAQPEACASWADEALSEVKRFGTVDSCEPSSRSALNETLLSDKFLLSWTPTFLIRHPALVCPSFYRAHTKAMNGAGFAPKNDQDAESQKLAMTSFISFEPMHKLYDFYQQNLQNNANGTLPVVIDASDIIHHPEVVATFCEMTGLNVNKMRCEWVAYTPEELAAIPAIMKPFLSSVVASNGIDKNKTPLNINIDAEVKKWEVEFGSEVAAMIEGWTRAAMPHYDYLRSKRIMPKVMSPSWKSGF